MAQPRNQVIPALWVALALACSLGTPGWAQATGSDAFESLLHQGFDLHQQARFAEAIPVLERAGRIAPGDYFVNLLLGIDLLRTGKAAQAVPHLQLAAHTKPGEEIPEEYLGEAEAGLAHYAQAAEAYQQAIQRGHSSEDSLEAWAGFALERFRALGERLRATAAGIAAARQLAQASAIDAASLACEGSIPAMERKIALRSSAPDAADQGVQLAYKLSVCYADEAGKAAGQLQSASQDPGAVHSLRGDVLLRLKGDARRS